jgi:Cu/Zn superoxide dismutase
VKYVLVVTAALVAAAVPFATAQARTEATEGAATRTVCHRTSSASRPYVKLRVTARQQARHTRHAADIIPAPRGACPRSVLTATSGGTALQVFLTGEAEQPAADPVGTGTATIRLRRGQGQVCYQVQAQNITLPSAGMHIHRGGDDANGPIVVQMRAPGSSGSVSGCSNASRALVAQILANRAGFYLNVHTTDFPGGAIRGQLAGTSQDAHGWIQTIQLTGAAECNAAGVCNLGDPDGAGTATIRLRQGQVCFRVRVQNIRLPSVGTHIHRGARTSAGGIVVNMTPPSANGVSSGCTATAQALIDEITANPSGFYANVHTTDFPAGAVRG